MSWGPGGRGGQHHPTGKLGAKQFWAKELGAKRPWRPGTGKLGAKELRAKTSKRAATSKVTVQMQVRTPNLPKG